MNLRKAGSFTLESLLAAVLAVVLFVAGSVLVHEIQRIRSATDLAEQVRPYVEPLVQQTPSLD